MKRRIFKLNVSTQLSATVHNSSRLTTQKIIACSPFYDSSERVMTIAESQQELLEELDLFQDWTERYEYVIGLGKKLSPLDESLKTSDRLIQGCQSQVWLNSELVDGKVVYSADSDSLITKGMIALFVRVLSGHSADDILKANMDFIDKTGLKEHLAPTRANALTLMSGQMKRYALLHSQQ